MAWWSPCNLWRMAIRWTLALLGSYFRLVLKIVTGKSTLYPRCAPASHSARMCIVTGASSGIGKATAEVLALEGYHVILAGRSQLRVLKAVRELQRKHEDISVYAMELDLCSVPSIVDFVKRVESWQNSQTSCPSLQLLVNNAGILATSRSYQSNGYDRMVMTNYLGPFILTNLLLPLLQKSSQAARIVNVVSFTHKCARSVNVQGLLARRKLSKSEPSHYEMAQVYEASKLCMLLFTYELHRKLWEAGGRHPRISVMAADPGVVQTSIMRELPWWLVQFTYMVLRGMFLLQSEHGGARSVVDAALSPLEVSGKYFFGGHGFIQPSSELSYNRGLAGELWNASMNALNATVDSSGGAQYVNTGSSFATFSWPPADKTSP